MAKQRDREEFVALMAHEGVPVSVARSLMHASATLTRIAELQCSSEAADRDRVHCPGGDETCLCRDYGSYTTPYIPGRMGHGTIPRINLQEDRVNRRVLKLCKLYGIKPMFSGDPRGAVLKLKLPSGRTNDWGQTGVCVP